MTQTFLLVFVWGFVFLLLGFLFFCLFGFSFVILIDGHHYTSTLKANSFFYRQTSITRAHSKHIGVGFFVCVWLGVFLFLFFIDGHYTGTLKANRFCLFVCCFFVCLFFVVVVCFVFF